MQQTCCKNLLKLYMMQGFLQRLPIFKKAENNVNELFPMKHIYLGILHTDA